MAKFLKDVLKGKNTTTKKTNDLGGYKPKAGDEEKFAKKHEIEVYDKTEAPEHQFKGGTKEAKFHKQKEGVYEAKKAEDVKCNNTPGQTWCPMHEMADCSSVKNIKELSTDTYHSAAQKAAKRAMGDAMGRSGPIFKKYAGMANKFRAKGMEQEKKEKTVSEGANVDRMVAHIKSSEKAAGKSDKKAESIAWATANKRGMLDNKNKVKKEDLAIPLLQGDKPTGHSDEAAEMARTELKALANKALHLVMKMPESMHVEPWCQAKIAQAKSMINDVHDYMIYGNHENEQTDTPMDITTASNPPNTSPNFAADVDTGRNV